MGGRTNLGRARDLLKELLQQSDSGADDETLYQLGWVLMDLGQTEDGMDRFNRLVAEYPESKYWSDAAFRIASKQILDGDFELANDMVEAILEKQNASEEIGVRTLLLKGQLAAQASDWTEVTTLMTKDKEKFANSSSMHSVSNIESKAIYWLAESLYQQQLYNKSSQEFAVILDDASLENDLKPWVRLRLAQCLGKLERWEDATNVAEDGLIQFGGFSHAHEFTFVKARALEARGLLDDARTLYVEVIESDSGAGSETAAIAQWRIGEVHFHRENYSVAIEAYRKVETLYDYDQWKEAATLQAGKCQEHLGNWKHAAKLYTQLIKKFPESEMALQARERLTLIDRHAKNSMQPKSPINANPKRR
jgi:TolA-binding protein